MVCLAEKPSLRAASCCNVEVVKGAAGDRRVSFFVTSDTTAGRFARSATILCAASSFLIASLSNDLPSILAKRPRNCPSLLKVVSMLQYSWGLNFWISRSRSTIRRRATDWTRPADNPRLTFFHKKGDSSYPTNRSRTRRACWASTKCKSRARGCSSASLIAVFVISWKAIRLISFFFKSKAEIKCQAIASPSLSSSVARMISGASLASFFSSATRFLDFGGMT